VAQIADACSRTLAFYVSQFNGWQLPTTFSIENPRVSTMWRLPWIAALSDIDKGVCLRRVDVDYCCYGNRGQKPTRFDVSRAIDTGWARKCDNTGACGSMTVTARDSAGNPTLRHVGPTRHGPATATTPTGLCEGLVAAVTAHHAPRRLRSSQYASVSVDFARAREMEWRRWLGSTAGKPHHRMH
jgi:hypothetical protein